MEKFVLAAMKRYRAVLTIMVALLIGGFISIYTIPKQKDPEISVPFISIVALHPGISPEDAERLITKPLEVELQQAEGLKQIYGIGAQNYGAVLVEFDTGYDAPAALNNVRALVKQAQAEFPEDTEEPIVKEIIATAFPSLFVSLSGNISERELLRNAEILSDEITSLLSVLDTTVLGEREELLEVLIDPKKMESYAITVNELLALVNRNNRVIPAGEIDNGLGRVTISVPGLFSSRNDILNLPIKVSGDAAVTLKDIAEIRRTYKDRATITRYNGERAAVIQVNKRLGENLLKMIEDVKVISRQYEAEWGDNIKMDFSFDASRETRDIQDNMVDSISNAVFLVMLLVVATLGYRSSLLVGIAIPTSFIIAILALNLLGYSLNNVLMFGIILSVGILVDGAIVVVEFADRKMAEGHEKKQAYALAAGRMFMPVVSSTATTLAAFLPMLFWPGVSGQYMKYFPITMMTVLSIALVAALVFLPVIGGLIGKTEVKDSQALSDLAAGSAASIEETKGFTGAYIRFLQGVLNKPALSIALVLLLVFGVFKAYQFSGSGVKYFPTIPGYQGLVMVRARGNLSLDDADRLVTRVEDIVLATPGIKSAVTQIASDLGYGSSAGARNDRPIDIIGTIFIEFEHYHARELGAFELLDDLTLRTANIPGIIVEVRDSEEGPPIGKDVQLELRSADAKLLEIAVKKSRAFFESRTDILTDIEDNQPLPGIEWILDIDREKAGVFGTDVSSVGNIVQMVTSGTKLGTYRPFDAEEEMDIRVRFPDAMRNIENMDSLRVMTPRGNIPISNFVERRAIQRKVKIDRLDGQRQFTIKANTLINPLTGKQYLATEGVAQIDEWLKRQDFIDGVSYRFRGSNEESAAAASFLGGAMIVALSLMAIILLLQFNNFYFALLTISTVPLATMGVLFGLTILQRDFVVIMTGVGVIALAGIVVNNAIVLIDTYQRLRPQCPTAEAAILKASAQRLRPILITTITTVAGMLPLSIGLSINLLSRTIELGAPVSFWWQDTALAVTFGLSFSTIITLGILPLMIILPERLNRHWGKFKGDVQNRMD